MVRFAQISIFWVNAPRPRHLKVFASSVLAGRLIPPSQSVCPRNLTSRFTPKATQSRYTARTAPTSFSRLTGQPQSVTAPEFHSQKVLPNLYPKTASRTCAQPSGHAITLAARRHSSMSANLSPILLPIQIRRTRHL